ncbi:GNAT family N-acetyltransferase [Clostridium chrysemydis]|uniref:GNAT family N-acetyltransferase n=1 Tax=Clostridium chrysemydis TaxID=2665504 RepID=UPI0018836167|nr:GNAT family N-acetyltransferase [Clostridium chrysemydis]
MKWELKKFENLSALEVYNILSLRNEVFIVEQECPYQDCDFKDLKSFHLFLKDDDKIIAYLRILERGISYDEVSIGRVIVKEAYRKGGISRDMMTKAIKFITEELNENTIKIQAQAYLINFYKSLGFKEVSEIYLEDNIPHIDMIYRHKEKVF